MTADQNPATPNPEFPEPQSPEGFVVNDPTSANWLARKIVEARQYAQHVEAWAAAEIRRAQREEHFFLSRYGPQLKEWVRQQLEANSGRSKSIPLPAGTVGFRTAPSSLVVVDQVKLIGWCRANLVTAIKTTETVMKTPLLEHLGFTGEVPDGTEVIVGGERFFIK